MEEYAAVCTCFQLLNAFSLRNNALSQQKKVCKHVASWNRGQSLPLYRASSCLQQMSMYDKSVYALHFDDYNKLAILFFIRCIGF